MGVGGLRAGSIFKSMGRVNFMEKVISEET